LLSPAINSDFLEEKIVSKEESTSQMGLKAIILQDLENHLATQKPHYVESEINLNLEILIGSFGLSWGLYKWIFTEGRFSFQNCYENTHCDGRAAGLCEFFNSSIAKKLDPKKPFTFYMPLDDSADLSYVSLKYLDFERVPFLMVDMTNDFYQAFGHRINLVPDPLLVTNEETFMSIRNRAKDIPFKQKKDVAFWRGNLTGFPFSIDIENCYLNFRHRLVDFSFHHPDYLNARFTSHNVNIANSSLGDKYTELIQSRYGSQPQEWVSPVYQTEFKYIVYADGNISSWGRLLFIMNAGSIPLVYKNYTQFYYPYLQDGVHYISIASNLTVRSSHFYLSYNCDAMTI
jgi:hypothetical protein